MSTLWLVRHARPLIDSGICYGRLNVAADAALTAAAAQELVEALVASTAKNFSSPTACSVMLRHSPLQRCEQLAHALIARQSNLAFHPHADIRLQEMDFGAWEGVPWNDIPRTHVDAWAGDLPHYAPGGGESLASMLQRVQAALQHSWLVDSQQGTRDVVWATHAGVIRCVQWLLQHGNALPSSAAWTLPAPGFGQWLALPWAAAAPCLSHQNP